MTTPSISSPPIPPELFPLVASFIPLCSAPKTLASLARASRKFYDIVRPLLYSRLVLVNEDDAISMTQRIINEPQIGTAVTELHIMADLSVETLAGERPFDVLEGLQMLVTQNLLPRLTALGVYLMNGWEYDESWESVTSDGRLMQDFWRSLRTACPHLQSLTLQNAGNTDNDPWFSGPVIDEFLGITQGLTTLRLEWIGEGLSKSDSSKIFRALPQFASSLHTLSLHADSQDLNSIIQIDFSNLKWLHLQSFVAKKSNLMTFCRCHPQLESISFINCGKTCFSDDVEEGFLPNLKHLKAGFADIRRLAPILPQLTSLSFTESLNCQVPYLLRAVLPTGLLGLKSLEIQQAEASWDYCNIEGVLWYETVDGRFCQETESHDISRDFSTDYMHSIVRSAPNLEELGLLGCPLDASLLKMFGPELAKLTNMKRFYYNGFSTLSYGCYQLGKKNHERLLAEFLSTAKMLAQKCSRLERVTSHSAMYLPYVSCIVERNSKGKATGVKRNDSVGMLIPAEEDDPFPSHNLISYVVWQ